MDPLLPGRRPPPHSPQAGATFVGNRQIGGARTSRGATGMRVCLIDVDDGNCLILKFIRNLFTSETHTSEAPPYWCAIFFFVDADRLGRIVTRGNTSKMGACCCCFFNDKPERENPMMYPARESLIKHKPKPAKPHHPPPPPLITYTESLTSKKPELFEQLKSGQSPKFMVFSCADSRVCPTLTLGLQPGEAFTVHNIAGMVPAYDKRRQCSVGSAIEFAVVVLKVECIIVIGHSCYGGIKELLSLREDRPNTFHFIDDWVKIGLTAKKKVERENTLLPFDQQCTVLEKGTLRLLGAHYDFVYGRFEMWDISKKQ
uniref:Carbonic anhydrase n=1 Tax=Leersia perrieri TaxID=77586 RepID=A0A0D9V3D5_9ORYZ